MEKLRHGVGTHPQSPTSSTAPAPGPGLALKLPLCPSAAHTQAPRILRDAHRWQGHPCEAGGCDQDTGDELTLWYPEARWDPRTPQRTPNPCGPARDGQEDSATGTRTVGPALPQCRLKQSRAASPQAGQMHIAAHQTPSPCSSLYLAVPPHAVVIDQPAGSISRFLLRYLSAPSISQSAPLSAVPVYTSSIYPCRLHRSRR